MPVNRGNNQRKQRLPKDLSFWWSVWTNQETGCWMWNGGADARGPEGYGSTWIQGKRQYVHRYAYELYKGTVPKGLHLDHLCFNKRCVNPNHLEAVTNEENARRGSRRYWDSRKAVA